MNRLTPALATTLALASLAVRGAEDVSILNSRNIFDANRRGSHSRSGESSFRDSRSTVPVAGQATLRLCGLWIGDGTATAILESNRGEASTLAVGATLGQWKVAAISAEQLSLVAGETKLELKPGMALVATGDGQWLPSATAVAPASSSGGGSSSGGYSGPSSASGSSGSSSSSGSSGSSGGSGASREEILKRLKERRQQQETKP